MKNKPYMIVKESEWKLMSEKTRLALIKMGKVVRNLTPEQRKEIMERPMVEAQRKSTPTKE